MAHNLKRVHSAAVSRNGPESLGGGVRTIGVVDTKKVNPLAGKPATASKLVNVPRLITAYYDETPDAHIPEQRVTFGLRDTAARRSKGLLMSTTFWL